MRNATAVRRFCHTLDGMQGSILLFARGADDLLLDWGFTDCYRELEAVRPGLHDLGLYETVKEAVMNAEALVRAGECSAAADMILEANRTLSQRSGADEALRCRYTSANDPN